MNNKLKAHVACDYTCNGKRQFTFTPLNSENKSVAAIQLDENGEILGIRLVERLLSKKDALVRWARVYLSRSVPVSIQ